MSNSCFSVNLCLQVKQVFQDTAVNTSLLRRLCSVKFRVTAAREHDRHEDSSEEQTPFFSRRNQARLSLLCITAWWVGKYHTTENYWLWDHNPQKSHHKLEPPVLGSRTLQLHFTIRGILFF